ncbi:MAG: hypothetical protein WCG95_07705, partial [bacterium]
MESLDSIERTIAEVSLLTHENIILKSKLSNGCYFISFFLQQFLKLNFSIDIVVIVGWIEASHLPHPFSHSWIEFNGKMTDINLWNAVSEDGDFSGDLIVNG